MAPPKKQKSKAAASNTDTKGKETALASNSPYSTFPLSRYASLLGSQTLGLGFTLGMLPRTRVLQPELAKLFGTQSEIKSSQDHPQHPFLDPLTESPARTLLWLCAGSFFLVAWSAGSLRLWHVGEQPTLAPAESKKAEGGEKTAFGVKITVPPTPARLLAAKDSLIATAFTFPIILLTLVLFGAPLDGHYVATSFLALLMSILTVWTPAFTFGLPSISSTTLKNQEKRQKWVDLFVEFSARSPIDRATVFPAIGAILGCWLGVLPMPLDWDRPWQAWPLTPAYMAIIGHAIGAGASLTVSIAQFLLIESQLEKEKENDTPTKS
ncbi:hypothetical protein BDV93DRAFT_520175 [Ceratobasidium sp. AG-I]|nr:hypothetical protein BDV93DRAFT_520175 [Ceratobasidium sp. AG-I]